MESIFSQYCSRHAADLQLQIDSAGTIGMHAGERADARMRAALQQRGYAEPSRSRQLCSSDLQDYQLIVAMDQSNMADIKALAAKHPCSAELRLCPEFSESSKARVNVPDPYYGGEQGFYQVIELLEQCCAKLADHVRKQQQPEA